MDFEHELVGDELLAAITSPGALERTIQTPGGPMPGAVFARLVAFDGLVHGWDLASATQQDWQPPEQLVSEVDTFAREAITAEMRNGDAFGPEQQSPPAQKPPPSTGPRVTEAAVGIVKLIV